MTIDLFSALIQSAGLPAPVREHRFALPRRWRFDYAWPDCLVALEVEGGVWSGGRHVRGKGYERDCEKYNAAALRGWRVFRTTTDMLQDGRALAVVAEALQNPSFAQRQGQGASTVSICSSSA